MSKKNKDLDLESPNPTVVFEAKPEVLPEPEPLPPPPVVVAKKEPLLSFDAWFPSLGYPIHYKAGMKAFVDTTGKRTAANWLKLFEKY